MTARIAQVVLPVPLHKSFDYLIGETQPVIGGRVRVPFGAKNMYQIGIVIALTQASSCPIDKLKYINRVIDDDPLLPESLYKVLTWACHYYQYPLGEAFSVVLPSYLRKGKQAKRASLSYWALSERGKELTQSAISCSKKQAQLITLLKNAPMTNEQLKQHALTSSVIKAVQNKGWIDKITNEQSSTPWQNTYKIIEEKPKLNQEQAIAVASINANNDFACYLIEGITGSGKTEVYLNLLEPILAKGQQALILVPEIGLTPQTINRFRRRFQVPVEVLHSALNDTERFNTWLAAKENRAAIIIGTRSALFSPCHQLGIIIVDEEHDTSYKQQDSFRYHARDLAVMRAYEDNIPVVLGSATPSLESLHNAISGKYHHLSLSIRAGHAIEAKRHIIDVRSQYLESGLSAQLLANMQEHLQQGNQVMLFLNRRGYAPALMCHECGWLAECKRCDAYYTYHQQYQELRCHHCDSQRPIMPHCEQCGSDKIISLGVGTEQLETQLEMLFPSYKTIRIDRDSTGRKGVLEQSLNAIYNNDYQILIGTQMLAKGHHFPNVTLVALIDVDSALFSNDFRASERLAQLLIQVTGRAGRANKAGVMFLQTHHPQHHLLQTLTQKGYGHFARLALEQRKLSQLPPYSFLVLFRADANHSENVEQFLLQVRAIFEAHPKPNNQCSIMGPSPAPLHRRANKFRWQLILQAPTRRELQQLLSHALPKIRLLPLATKKVRWSLDIEPQDMS